MGQWEHELVCQRYEKPLILQMCRLLRGFTHPGTYFEGGATCPPSPSTCPLLPPALFPPHLIIQHFATNLILLQYHPLCYTLCTASTEELALFSVEKFAEEMDGLLDITLRSRLVEKMAMALFDCLFEDFGEKRSNGNGGRRRNNRSGNEEKDSLGVSSYWQANITT